MMKTVFFSAIACLITFYSFAQSPRILVPFRLANKWGYSDTLGEIKIKPKYDTVSLFDYNMVYKGGHVFAQVRLNAKPMMINEKDIVIVPPKYDDVKLINGLEEPTFIISKNNKFGLFGKGRELFSPVSDWLSDPYPGLYEIHVNGKYGLINTKGEILIPAIYDLLQQWGNQNAGLMKYECIVYGKEPEIRKIKLPDDNWLSQPIPESDQLDYLLTDKMIDSVTKEFGFDSVQSKYHAAVVYKDEKRGIILPDAKKKVYFFSKSYNISYIKYFSPSSRNSWNKNSAAYIIARLNGKYGMMNEREEQVLPFKYDNIEERDGFFLLKENGKTGFFIWNTVYPVIEPEYDEYVKKQYIPVNNGWRFILFKVVNNGKSGFVGENGIAYFKD